MKLFFRFILPLVIIFLVLPTSIFATSGCCSGHKGVNCSAGAQANGHVICNDGNRNSSCSYSSMIECDGNSAPVYIPVQTAAPVIYTSVPTLAPTVTVVYVPVETTAPTVTSTATPTVTQTPTLIPTSTPQPQIKGIESEKTTPGPTTNQKPLTAGDTATGLSFVIILLGLPAYLIYKWIKKI